MAELPIVKDRRLAEVRQILSERPTSYRQKPIQQLHEGFKPTTVKKRYFVADQQGKRQPLWYVRKKDDKGKTYFTLVQKRKYPHSPFGDADKDNVLNIFDMRPLSSRIRKQVPPAVKEGNYKLSSLIGVFSLPRYKTCPGKTKLCAEYCYAEAPERFRPSVVYSRNKNMAWTLRPDFASVVGRMIKSLKLPYFRIHESGDFYDQKYFEKWVEIAKMNPNTKFLAYTKNYHLDFTSAPKNLTIRYSTDVSSEYFRNDLSQCFVGVNEPKNYFNCKKKCEPGFCMACWDNELDIFIPVHSVGKDNVQDMFFKQFNPNVPKDLKKRDIKARKDHQGIAWGTELSKKKRKELEKEVKIQDKNKKKPSWS